MTFEQMERTMEFMLEQQARSLEHQAQTDAKFKETGEILNKVGRQLDILTADFVTFDARLDKLRAEIASVKDVAIAHNQAIHQLFKRHEQTEQKFDRLHEQRKDDFELNQQNFEILNEQRERDAEETRNRFESAEEEHARNMEEIQKRIEESQKRMEETDKKFELAEEQHARNMKEIQKRIEESQKRMEEIDKKFELADEQHARNMEEIQKRFELIEQSSVEAFDLMKQLTRKIDSLTDTMTGQNRNGSQ